MIRSEFEDLAVKYRPQLTLWQCWLSTISHILERKETRQTNEEYSVIKFDVHFLAIEETLVNSCVISCNEVSVKMR